MRAGFWILAVSFIAISLSHAEVPDPVLKQLRADMRAALLAIDPNITDQRIEKESRSFEARASDAGSTVAKGFVFTRSELAAFEKGTSPPSDAELDEAVNEIRKVMGTKPLPHVLAYYESLRPDGKLTPQQRILHLRLCRIAMAGIKEGLSRP